MFDTNVNLLAVLLTAVARMAIGYAWYSLSLFGKPWMKLVGLTEEKIKAASGSMPKTMGLAFVASLIAGYILAILMDLTGMVTLMEALQLGFLVWLGFSGMTLLVHYLFTQKSLNLWVIDAGYELASFLAMAAVLSLFS